MHVKRKSVAQKGREHYELNARMQNVQYSHVCNWNQKIDFRHIKNLFQVSLILLTLYVA